MKDVKVLLKEARELIKNKNYTVALRVSKNILKLDNANYMGLVFFGLSAQESGISLDQALVAFKKATKLNPDNILAWNGLMNFYEKQIDAQKDENQIEMINLTEVYVKLLQLEMNDNKILEVFHKLVNHLPNTGYENVMEILFAALSNENYSEETRICMRQHFVKYFAQQNLSELNNYLSLKYEELLNMLISNSKTRTAKYYLDYLKVLHKNNKTEELFNASQEMYTIYENCTALEWICKLYNEAIIENKPLPSTVSEDKIINFCEILIGQRNNSESYMAKFTKALIIFNDGNILEVRQLLEDVLEHRPGLLHAWYLLAKCFEELEIYSKALEAIIKADKLSKSINDSNNVMRHLIDRVHSNVLSQQTDMNHLNCGEELTKRLLDVQLESNRMDDNRSQLTTNLIRISLKKEDYTKASKLIDSLRCTDVNVLMLEVEMLMKQNKLDEALEKLNATTTKDCYDYYKILGVICWKLNRYDESLMPLLKAVKCKPYSYVCFLYLGHYYKMFKNLDKARRCYEKAFHINMDCLEAGIELTKIYRINQNWDANLNLLESVTMGKMTTTNEWAYLQLGIHYLEHENYSKAIDSLCYIVRSQPNNSHFWEALGDAYFARGSYISASKSYQRACELCDDNLYSLLQIANIKLLLQEYVEAKKAFEGILAQNIKYLPALKGLAETRLKQGEIHQKNQLFGLARDCAQCALDNVTLGLTERSDISCLWQIAANACFLIAKLPDRYSCAIVPIALADNKDAAGNRALEREYLFDLAARCFCRALKLFDEDVSLWYDLAVCYTTHAGFAENREIATDLYEKAFACTRHCVEKDANNWRYWNLFGNLSLFKEPKNYAFAQHAFIKSITLEQDNAISWCNLGTLYLVLGKIPLANKAFSQAQRSDPNYVNSWVGQALIAEMMGHVDAMDLFRHSTQLIVHPEGSIGYGHWVCKTLLENPPDKIIYAIHNMHAVTVAHDTMSWYTERNQEDACGWTIYGILSERLGLIATASMAYKKATLFCDAAHRDQAYINYGRVLMESGQFKKSIETYRSVKVANFNSGSGLALSLFKAQRYEESYDAYEAAYDWLTDVQIHQSDLLVALASMALLFAKRDDAKQLLLKSTLLKPPSPWALYAALSYALLYDDADLAELVLVEMRDLEKDAACLEHYATLMSHFYLLQGDSKRALIELSKLVHKHPDQAAVWYQLAILLLRLRDRKKYAKAAAKSAQTAMVLGRNAMDVTKVMCLVSLACFLANDRKKAMIYAQKAIHCYPNVVETWTVFLCSLLSSSNTGGGVNCKNVANFIRDCMEPSAGLCNWLEARC